MARYFLLVILLISGFSAPSMAAPAKFITTPYSNEQKVVFDFFLDDPNKINSALYWLKALIDPLLATPYNTSPDDIKIKVVIHGTELVTLAKHNYQKYRDAVERMRYYHDLGVVEYKVCDYAARDYGYTLEDFQDFVQVVPSAIAELAHWQNHGYVLITPQIQEKIYTIDEIR